MSSEKKRVASVGARHVACLALAALLVYCAVVQYNDPDPALWIALYGVGALLLVLGAAGWLRRWPILLTLAAYAVVAAAALPGFVEWLLHQPFSDLTAPMSAEQPHIEASREFLGLVIAGVSVASLWPAASRQASRGKTA